MANAKHKALEGAQRGEKYDIIRFYSPSSGGHRRVIKRGVSLKEAQENATAHGAEHSKGKFFHGYNPSGKYN